MVDGLVNRWVVIAGVVALAAVVVLLGARGRGADAGPQPPFCDDAAEQNLGFQEYPEAVMTLVPDSGRPNY